MNDLVTDRNENKIDNDEIDLRALFNIAWNAKFFIILFTSVVALSSVVYAIWLPNTYTSSVLLSPVNQNDSLSSKIGSYSALAGLAGVSLPGEAASKSAEGIERIRSFSFFEKYFLPNTSTKDLIAAIDWNHEENIVIYDEDLYDVNTGTWIREVSYPLKRIPTAQEAYKIYKEKIAIFEDKKTKFVSISISHVSPYVAKNWIDIIVKNINESMREQDKKIASNAIIFLNESAKKTDLNPLKEGISKLLETQMQTLMLASANESYVFQVIDSPIVSEKHSGPPRAIICILSTIFAAVFSLLAVYINHFRLRE